MMVWGLNGIRRIREAVLRGEEVRWRVRRVRILWGWCESFRRLVEGWWSGNRPEKNKKMKKYKYNIIYLILFEHVTVIVIAIFGCMFYRIWQH